MKYVYSFSEGNKDMRDVLGGKGANLAEMTRLGLPVPSGFTVSTSACVDYLNNGSDISKYKDEIMECLTELQNVTNKKFGDRNNPLLVSVRSGARESMPGMLDTILNLGLNDEVCLGLIEKTNNPRFVYDSYRRLISMYSDVVMSFPKENFDKIFDKVKNDGGYKYDYEISSEDLKRIVHLFKEEYKRLAGDDFPVDPYIQLMNAIEAVFRSWNNDRAKVYRKLNNIDDSWGTAVNVQEMVYGNFGDMSGTGVAFTRNPATGEDKLFGEYLINAQGEDVVAGVRTPMSIDTLKEKLPNCYSEFLNISKKLEEHYKDMQDMEFTIEEGKLYILQTRSGKRTVKAMIKIATDLVHEGLIDEKDALLRVDSDKLGDVLHPEFVDAEMKKHTPIVSGLAASPGAAVGKICFSAEDVKKYHDMGDENLILVREETSPEDIEGMSIANGILTVRGGMTSHAAVVARGMGKACISGCGDIIIDINNKTITTKDKLTLHEGDIISLDGSTGNVYSGEIPTSPVKMSSELEELMSWADKIRKISVRANADTKEDVILAKKFGASGVGLCRSEHMFFKEDKIFTFRKVILSNTLEEREKALEELLPYQRQDFVSIFKEMGDMPVVIRLLDPPLHEFLPKLDSEKEALAKSLNISLLEVNNRINKLKEFNPMMGHRGCRLDITYPEVGRMQVRAVIEALVEVRGMGVNVVPEVMIPLVINMDEAMYVKKLIQDEAEDVFREKGVNYPYKIGTMIETPRAVLISDKLAEDLEFFSFGTNDLTQLTLGFSRDDSPKFINSYLNKKILKHDPFTSIDVEGVGKFVELSTLLARKKNKDIELGVCGEHGGDYNSILFFNKIGLDYVSCSPYRVMSARLAGAQAEIIKNNG